MTEDLYAFDEVFRANGVLCGVDEAGRGPLCGPVCVAAVILDPANPIEGLNDSKKLSEKKGKRCSRKSSRKRLPIMLSWWGRRRLMN